MRMLNKYVFYIDFRPYSFMTRRTWLSSLWAEIEQSIERFFRRPILVPSGVSMGQSLPKWVGWSSRASKFSCDADNGETTRCKWLNVSRKLRRWIRWEIPFLPPTHVPVAIEL